MSLKTTPPAFLTEHVASLTRSPATKTRPHITLTWAQSLDAKIAGPGGARVTLSGEESMLMTHWLRTMHDAILIGVQTVVMDDPRLKIQLVPQDDPALLPPQPLVLDPQLRMSPAARMLTEWRVNGPKNATATGAQIVRQPWILCGLDADEAKERAIVEACGRVVRVPLVDGRIAPAALPGILRDLGLGSVMIEGGSRVLASFLHSPTREDGTPLVDSVVVTVAPMFIGEGVGVVPPGADIGLPALKYIHTETMGKDAVMVCALAQ